MSNEFFETYAIIADARQSGDKKRKLAGVKLGEKAPKTVF